MEQRIIPFQKPYRLETARPLAWQVLASGRTEGDGPMTARCQAHLASQFSPHRSSIQSSPHQIQQAAQSIFLVTSGTAALELAVQALKLQPGDEVIVPSFAYPSAANAVLLAGGTVVYCEVEPVHLTLDPARLPLHITPNTRAVILVHYGGISCDLAPIHAICTAHDVCIIEDCAQSYLSTWQGRPTGTFGTFGCFSFHGTKDVVCGEGGALLVNDPSYLERVRLFRQKGTNRDAFTSGQVAFYDWQSVGSSYAPSELAMALLLSQLELAPEILSRKRHLFDRYVQQFTWLLDKPACQAQIAGHSTHREPDGANGHLFYLLLRDPATAAALIRHLAAAGIEGRTHFVPLHESPFGRRFIRPANDFSVESGLGQRLVRLPLFAAMSEPEQDQVIAAVDAFFQGDA
ncbi:MAG: aminotransferase class V-fold PLP-dependent enzyme [Clostridia bacterium]|nr:aminotransferase class V-fold PLP-dependent enzyme [Clostridia bacterium]